MTLFKIVRMSLNEFKPYEFEISVETRFFNGFHFHNAKIYSPHKPPPDPARHRHPADQHGRNNQLTCIHYYKFRRQHGIHIESEENLINLLPKVANCTARNRKGTKPQKMTTATGNNKNSLKILSNPNHPQYPTRGENIRFWLRFKLCI